VTQSSTKDEVFKHKLEEIKQFVFDEKVANAFDDMISRSVPRYEDVTKATSKLAKKVCRAGGTVLDLGCSTGNSLLTIAREIEGLRLVGIDNSAPMLKLARKKAESQGQTLELIEGDLLELALPSCDLAILNYTLQFIPLVGRAEFLGRVFQALNPGGALIITEKLASDGPHIGAILTDLYYDLKRENHYSELEISQKREALENFLIPLTLEANLTLLRESGFHEVELYLKWINFGTFVALKN